MALLFVSIIVFGTNMVTVDVTVEPPEGAHFSDPPSVTLLNDGGFLQQDYFVHTYLFITSEDMEVESGTLQVRIQLFDDTYLYETREINVPPRLLPRETWPRMVRLDVEEFTTTTIKYTLLEDDDGDGTYTLEKDTWETTVRVYPDRGGSLTDEDITPLDRLPEVPCDPAWRELEGPF